VAPIEGRAVFVPNLGAPPTANARTIAPRRCGIGVRFDGLEIDPAEFRNRKISSSESNIGVLSDAPAAWLLGCHR
jgi:hypothetical protein